MQMPRKKTGLSLSRMSVLAVLMVRKPMRSAIGSVSLARTTSCSAGRSGEQSGICAGKVARLLAAARDPDTLGNDNDLQHLRHAHTHCLITPVCQLLNMSQAPHQRREPGL